MTWKSTLVRAINAETAAEKAAEQAEGVRRATWWNTTWALAAVPRDGWAEAQAEYVRRTSHSIGYAKERRSTGERLTQSRLATTLPQPRFAQEAARWLGRGADDEKVAEALRMLAEAEKDGQSLREFKLALTGQPWTNAPENMTEAQEEAVVSRVARSRPEVVARQARKPAVARSIARDPSTRAAVRTEEVAAIRENPPEWVAQNKAKYQAAKDNIEAGYDELLREMGDAAHPIETDLAMALRWARMAAQKRSEFNPSQEQDARISAQADEMDMLMLVVRGSSALDEDALRALLEEADG